MIRFIHFFAIVLVSFLSVTAGGSFVMEESDSTPIITPVEDKALLVFMRTTSFSFSLLVDNYVDGKWIGQTRKKSCFQTEIEPGEHFVQCGHKGKWVRTEKLPFEAGRIYFLKQIICKGPPFTVCIAIDTMGVGEAREQLPECHYYVQGKKRGKDLKEDVYKDALEEFAEESKEDPDRHRNVTEYRGYTSLK
jgi:hypothetical protein